MEINPAYEGREHSAVKHELLEGYLEKLLFIKGVSGTREITYVDCFAGPYNDESKDIQTTSIAKSLGILKKVRDALAAQKKYVTIRAVYVEKDIDRYGRLESYLGSSSPSGIKTFSIHGDYAKKLDEILELSGKSFTFFFIDPLGWTDVGISRLRKLLERPSSEFLITFMYDPFNRFVQKTDLRKQVAEMLGALSDADSQKISSLQPKDREKFIVHKYREQIMAVMKLDGAQPRPRSYHAVVKDKDKEKTKYHLVYATRHHKGIVKFAEQSAKTEFFQRVVRIQVKQNADPNRSLFQSEEEAELMDDARVDLGEVKQYWLKQLSDNPVIFDEEKLADMLQDTDWLISDFEEAFKELLAEGRVENLNGSPRRTKNPIHFDKGEQLRRCV